MIDIAVKNKLNILCLQVVREILEVSCNPSAFPYNEKVKTYFSNYINNHRSEFSNRLTSKEQKEALTYSRALCFKIYQEEKSKYPLYLDFIAKEQERLSIKHASLIEFNLFLDHNKNPHILNYLTYELIPDNKLDKIKALSQWMKFNINHCIYATHNESIFKYIVEHSHADKTKLLHEHIAYLTYESQCYLVDMGARLTSLDETMLSNKHSQILEYEKALIIKDNLSSKLSAKDNIKKTKI